MSNLRTDKEQQADLRKERSSKEWKSGKISGTNGAPINR